MVVQDLQEIHKHIVGPSGEGVLNDGPLSVPADRPAGQKLLQLGVRLEDIAQECFQVRQHGVWLAAFFSGIE